MTYLLFLGAFWISLTFASEPLELKRYFAISQHSPTLSQPQFHKQIQDVIVDHRLENRITLYSYAFSPHPSHSLSFSAKLSDARKLHFLLGNENYHWYGDFSREPEYFISSSAAKRISKFEYATEEFLHFFIRGLTGKDFIFASDGRLQITPVFSQQKRTNYSELKQKLEELKDRVSEKTDTATLSSAENHLYDTASKTFFHSQTLVDSLKVTTVSHFQNILKRNQTRYNAVRSLNERQVVQSSFSDPLKKTIGHESFILSQMDESKFINLIFEKSVESAAFDLAWPMMLHGNEHPLFMEAASILLLKAVDFIKTKPIPSEYQYKKLSDHFISNFKYFLQNKHGLNFFSQKALGFFIQSKETSVFAKLAAGSLIYWLKQNDHTMYVKAPTSKELYNWYQEVATHDQIKPKLLERGGTKPRMHFSLSHVDVEIDDVLRFIDEQMLEQGLKPIDWQQRQIKERKPCEVILLRKK